MPELPEVETIRLGLHKKIIGQTLRDLEILTPKSFQGEGRDLIGKKVLDVKRRAKVLIINLENNLSILFHLKMSGQLIYEGNKRFIGGHPTKDMVGEMPNKHTRVVFTFDDNSKLFFNDQRRFGWVKVLKTDEILALDFISSLGPEPLEKNFTQEIFKQRLISHKTLPIKVALLDQSSVAGIGNIYANEACFNAKVNPKKIVSKLQEKDWEKLFDGTIKALSDGIKYGGSTKVHFVDVDGQKGLFLDYAFVYNRDGKPCKVCGTKIQKITLRGRGTFYCPNCQKE